MISPPDDLLSQVHPRWLGRQVQGQTLADALERPYPLFVKPVVPKAFRAAVYEVPGELAQETVGLSESTSVIVSEPVNLTSEVRCLVFQGRVVSAAVYEGDADIGEAAAFAGDFVTATACAVTYILDVGWIEGRGWAVVEANAVWGGGLNGCDPDQMVNCLALATRPAGKSLPE